MGGVKEVLLSFLFALIVGSMINGCSQSGTPGQDSATTPEPSAGQSSSLPASSQIQEVSESTFAADVIKANGPVLVEFGAKWCQPCRQMAPILEEVASQYTGKLKVMRVDVDENHELSEQYAQGGLPTFVLFKGGKPKQVFVGFTAKPELVKTIEPFLS